MYNGSSGVLRSLFEYWKSDGERFVSEKPNDKQRLIEKMRANREQENRKTESLPLRRSRRPMLKTKPEAAKPAEKA